MTLSQQPYGGKDPITNVVWVGRDPKAMPELRRMTDDEGMKKILKEVKATTRKLNRLFPPALTVKVWDIHDIRAIL